MTDDSNVAAGWYADPLDERLERYWNGTGWTKEIRGPGVGEPSAPIEPAPVPAPRPSGRTVEPAPSNSPPPLPAGVLGSPSRPLSTPGSGAAIGGAVDRFMAEDEARWKIGAGILSLWAAIAVLRIFLADGVFSYAPFYNDAARLSTPFSSAWGALGVFGALWGWFDFFSIPFGVWLLRLVSPFTLLTAAVGVFAALALAKGHDGAKFRQFAALSAVAHIPLFFVLYIPLINGFWAWDSFLVGLFLASILPVVGAALLWTGVSDAHGISFSGLSSGAGRITSPLDMTATRAVSNGTRMGATIVEALLMILTLYIGWFVWSMVIWNRGLTPAKQLMGLTVIDTTTGLPASFGKMALREWVGKGIIGTVTCGVTAIVSIFMVLFGETRTSIHDNVASTMVVKTPTTTSG